MYEFVKVRLGKKEYCVVVPSRRPKLSYANPYVPLGSLTCCSRPSRSRILLPPLGVPQFPIMPIPELTEEPSLERCIGWLLLKEFLELTGVSKIWVAFEPFNSSKQFRAIHLFRSCYLDLSEKQIPKPRKWSGPRTSQGQLTYPSESALAVD